MMKDLQFYKTFTLLNSGYSVGPGYRILCTFFVPLRYPKSLKAGKKKKKQTFMVCIATKSFVLPKRIKVILAFR